MSRLEILQNAVQYLNLGLHYHHINVSKIIGAYASAENTSLIVFILKQLKSVLWDLVISEGLDYDSFQTSDSILDLVRVYTDSLQVLNRIGSHWGVIELFTK